MKSRTLLGIIAAAAAATALCLVLWLTSGRRPFKELDAAQIQSVHVRLIPPSVQYDLDAEQQEALCLLLRDVVTYRAFSPEPMAGQFVEFTFVLQDGSTHTVQPFGEIITLDGVSFRTAYDPSEALNAFANQNIPA